MKTLRYFLPTLLLAAAFVAHAADPAAIKPVLLSGTPVTDVAWGNAGEKLHFVVVGDRTGGGIDEWPLFDLAMEEINRLRPDFAIMVGDQIQGYTQEPAEIEKEWQEFRQHANALQVPFFILPGNHDLSSPAMLEWWRKNNGRTYYSFDYKGCHFLVLNTHEYWQQNDSSIGPEQVRFAVEDLERSKGAQHTFVFMHVPVWQDGGSPDWTRIESALGNRPHTVFAGHLHRLMFERRNGARYIVVATTRGLAPRRDDSQLMQLGNFAHYTNVTVEGGDADISYIEPGGATWPEDVAPIEFQRAARDLLQVGALVPSGLDTDTARVGVTGAIANGLPGVVNVTFETVPATKEDWRPEQGGLAQTYAVEANTKKDFEAAFGVATAKVVPVPRIRCSVTYEGKLLYGFERNMPLFPDANLRIAGEWRAVGPFNAGTVPTSLPANPREALPKLFEARGPEQGFSADAAFAEGDKALAWQTLKTEGGFVNMARLGETPDHSFGYAACSVKCPKAKTVYAEFRADDYGQIFVNGKSIENERLFRTRSDATYVALPFHEGWNAVTVKCVNATGGWTFRMRFADPVGELEFAAEAK